MRKVQLFTWLAFALVFFNVSALAQSDASNGTVGLKQENSGCVPSSCRGAKTKFGEAKVITDLRSQLMVLKSMMKLSSSTEFSPRSYDQENIVGQTDGESLAIIVKEVKLIEGEFYSKLGTSFQEFELPKGKAKQARYVKKRLDYLLTVI